MPGARSCPGPQECELSEAASQRKHVRWCCVPNLLVLRKNAYKRRGNRWCSRSGSGGGFCGRRGPFRPLKPRIFGRPPLRTPRCMPALHHTPAELISVPSRPPAPSLPTSHRPPCLMSGAAHAREEGPRQTYVRTASVFTVRATVKVPGISDSVSLNETF
jgi:hypothetical protein